MLPNVDVLPPGQGRVVGVDVVEFMPVGSDVLLGIFGILISYSDRMCLPVAEEITGAPDGSNPRNTGSESPLPREYSR